MALNPIAFTEQVVSDFLRYQLTTYPLADADLHAQMRALLRLEETRSTPLRQGPFLTLSRPFRGGATIEQLVRDGVMHPGMQGIATYPSVRQHQEDAIRAIHAGRTTLVATGTGSGKTEAFLYPIISRCLELADADVPPGIVAVLVYPMNALAEDQLDRLRGLLAGRGIPFGMYVGKTPDDEAGVRGERMRPGSSNADYRARLRQMREAGDAATLIPPEERASRQAMRRDGGQPRILLTNVKQLELLLTRGKDIGLFANAPLEFLVFDEGHTFRGAQGAETACLIRRLRSFCGKGADEVTCVATSATMADPERGPQAAADFARRFFGVDAGSVQIVGEVYDELQWAEVRPMPVPTSASAADVLARLLVAVDAPDAEVAAALSACLTDLGGTPLPANGWQAALAAQLSANGLVFQLAQVLRTPRALAELPALLLEALGRELSPHEILCWLALGAACGRDAHDPLLRPVVHSFIRGVGGAVVTLSREEGAARLWLAGEDAEGDLDTSWRRFPLLTCTTCGQHYYETWVKDFKLVAGSSAVPEGGDRVGTRRLWDHLAQELGGARALVVDRLVVRPDEDDDADALDEEGLVDEGDADAGANQAMPSAHDYAHRRLHPLWLCAHCGALHDAGEDTCVGCQASGPLVPVQAVRTKEDLPGVLHSCVACQAPGRRPGGGRYREPARPVRAVSVSDVHVLAQSMLHLSERPRLLVFADNRQDAAFQAGWMRDHARRFRLRALMAQGIPPTGASVGDVMHHLDEVLEQDRELSRALIPEVWNYVPQDDAGVRHREQRRYFLRIQVLRELATGVKQRIGLEPWGRLRVEYSALDAGHPFIEHWAGRLATDQTALTEGVAALLDHLRRIRVLHDESKIFSRFWRGSDYQVQYGFLPAFSGGPRGAKLSRLPSNLPARVTQWIGTRPTQVWNAISTWGVAEDDREDFLRDLWTMLTGARLLVPVTLEGWRGPLPGSAGTYQVDSTRLRLLPHQGRWRCDRCRRTTVRRGPTAMCMAWRCGGHVVWEVSDPDDFDLHVLDGDYAMLRVAEHSAQVPAEVRERIENQFKGEGEHVNALVCTPTLELGVDIGALDAVLMRNVPPSAANYWQRAGRAGRRHRMAVDITYAQATGFDQAYFRDPLKLLGGVVEPPRFNLRNEVMLRKHVHATVLTALHGLARRGSPEVREQIEEVLQRCIPSTLKPYLFTVDGSVRPQVLDVSDLGLLVRQYRATLFDEVVRTFTSAWPVEDAAAVDASLLGGIVDGMAQSLAAVLRRFKRRLDWARGELARLAREEAQKGVLDGEDLAHRRRCERLIERFKGQARRTRAQAQGGIDDSDTMGALAREGFLPGYGLEAGAIVATAEPPPMTHGLSIFDLPRAPTLALREYVPGNAIYANGFRFVPRRFQLAPEETMRFSIDPERAVVQELGAHAGAAALAEQEIRAVPVCDVIMPSQSQISDEEDFRFQMPVAVYGTERGFHRGGTAWSWGALDVRTRRALQLRMVNVGPRGEVAKGSLGYLLCLACGQSHSPYASALSKTEFSAKHQERCSHRVEPTGFFADVEVDVLGIHDASDRAVAFSFIEAMRMGAARVLDMEVEDLQLLALGHPGEERVDVLLYDPMPGGSGLLEQLVQRWADVRAAAIELCSTCPSACERACIDCLHTYRNRFYHEHLDRHRALEVLEAATGPLVEVHPIPEQLPTTATTTGLPQTVIEQRFRRFLLEAGLPTPLAQHRINLAGNHYTIPDFFYPGDDDDGDEPGIAIYLDGMSGHIHGNPEQAERDRFLREQLRARGYEVVEVRSFELDDRNAMVAAVARIAKYLIGKDKQRSVREDTAWFDRAVSDERPRTARVLRFVRTTARTPDSIPIVDLRAAAGAFSTGQSPEEIGHAVVQSLVLRPGYFVAQIIGDSMNEVAPPDAWCLWQHLGVPEAPAVAPGENLLVRRPTGSDPEFGEYTFKQLAEGPDGRSLMPRSTNPAHRPIAVPPEADLAAIARFVSVLDGGVGDSEQGR